jgi:hypothetical protein
MRLPRREAQARHRPGNNLDSGVISDENIRWFAVTKRARLYGRSSVRGSTCIPAGRNASTSYKGVTSAQSATAIRPALERLRQLP